MTIIDAAYAALARHWADQADAAHDLGHIRRVWANARQLLADAQGADAEALHLAVIFHDVINLPKDSPDRAMASQRSADFAAEWLRAQAWAEDRIALVTHAIEAHSFSAKIAPQTVEARILQDADRLEALGAIGLARMFSVAGAMGGALFDDADPMALNRALNDRAYALDHLEVKLFHLAGQMQTELGRAIAAERSEWMASFRTRLLHEIG